MVSGKRRRQDDQELYTTEVTVVEEGPSAR